MGNLKTIFEWEMFGVGVDASQTTIRLRHAYGELGKWGVGQYWSPFMDIDVFPNTLEYWGPNGMAFFRNVQFRYMPIQGDTRLTIAIERPGASGDQGVANNVADLGGIVPIFRLDSPPVSMGRPWGYVELAGIVRQMEWDDVDRLSERRHGVGPEPELNLKLGRPTSSGSSSSTAKASRTTNDAPADLGVQFDPADSSSRSTASRSR